MTTENVTVLFTDMVGSTALASSLPPDAADEVRREHFAILRRAIAETGGTEVKNLGDGLMVVFPTASSAIASAVSMQQGTEHNNRRRETALGLRVGLSAGEASTEDGDYFGSPVVEAARLCAQCEAGQIFAADVVRLLAGRRSVHECRPIGELALKGLPEPLPTVEVGWAPLAAAADADGRVPLPVRLAQRPRLGVVGRAAEAEIIADAWKRVAAGDGREVVLVSGEAGLGKTTLVAEAARVAFDAGACVLLGHAEEDLAAPYQLFAEALGHYVTHASEDRLYAHTAEHGSELARLVPALTRRLPDLAPPSASDADTERYLLFAAAVGLFVEAARDRPVFLVLEDLHWADKASLQLLRHLVAAESTARLLVVGTFRDTELSTAHPLLDTLAALRRMDGVTRCDLLGLDDREVLALLEAAAGHTLGDDGVSLAQAVYRETDGNPFFATEVLRDLRERRAVYQDDEGRWVIPAAALEVALPDSIREVIGARVGRLGGEAQRVLSIAAVIGRDFDLDLLAHATGETEDDLLDLLEAAGTAALVREPDDASGRYTFAHALVQHTLYEDLGSNRRARAHRQVAEALEAMCGDRVGDRIGELARHWVNASQPVDLLKAVDYSRQAGDAALAALAPADALQWYAQALDLYPQSTDPAPSLAVDVMIGLGTAQRQTGDAAYRDTLVQAGRRAAQLGETERLIAAVLVNTRGIVGASSVDDDKIELLELALQRLAVDRPERALLLGTLAMHLGMAGSFERRQALAEEAITIAERSGDDSVFVRVVNALVEPLGVPWLVGELGRRTSDAVARAERVGDPALLFWARHWRAQVALRADDIAEADANIARASALAEQLDWPQLQWVQTNLASTRAQLAGDTDLAEQLANVALQIGLDSGEPDAMILFAPQAFAVAQQRGTRHELIAILEQIAADAPDVAGQAIAALAAAYVAGDRPEDARRLLETLASADYQVHDDTLWLSTMMCWCDAAMGLGDPVYARPLLDALAPWGTQWATMGVVGLAANVSCYLGGLATVLGQYDNADASFAHAAAMCERAEAKYWTARTNLMWGTMLAQRSTQGDVERARELLDAARRLGAANGYADVERRATDETQRLDTFGR